VHEPDTAAFGQRLAKELEEAHRLGARGVKIFKALGLTVRRSDGALLAADDPALDPLFEAAAALGMPVAIHTGDPVAFWLEPSEDNERYDELSVHPGWSYYGRTVPSWEALFEGYERLVARHPKTTFIGVHFGNAPEDPERVGRMLAKYPNLYVDTAARVPELGRRDPAAMRALFITWQDRILFGTDLGVGEAEGALMFGSTGASPPGPADEERFYASTYRWFQTRDRQIPSPTPVQGRWSIDGIGLPDEVLVKVYSGNATRLLGL
jgi:predicted TIM-barrel fold metal-dependent hydrolase